MSDQAARIDLSLIGLVVTMVLAMAGLSLTPPRLVAASGGRVVRDALGVAVTLPNHITRAAPMFPPSIDDFLVVTGRQDTLVAMADVNRPAMEYGLLGRMYPLPHAVPLVPSARSDAGAEAMLLTRPNVIYANPGAAATYRRVGLTVLAIVNTGDERYASEAARLYADGMGEADRQPALLADYRARMAGLAVDLRRYAPARQPTVLTLYDLQGRLFALGGGTVQTMLVEAARGRNAIATRGPAQIDPERLLRLDPDVIVVMNTSPPSVAPAAIRRDPVLATLKAVRTGRVYRTIPGLQFFPGGLAGMPIYARWLAELLHPAMPAALRHDARADYRRATGYRLTDADLDRVLALSDNRGAAGYARFATQ